MWVSTTRGSGLRLNPEAAPHERVDAAEVSVGAGRKVLRRLPGDLADRGGAERRVGAELPRVERPRAVRDRIGNSGAAVTGRLAGRDRVPRAAQIGRASCRDRG